MRVSICEIVSRSIEATLSKDLLASVSGDLIPSGPRSEAPGEYLLLNCLCGEPLASRNPIELLEILRQALLSILLIIREHRASYRGALIRFACPGMRRNSDGSIPRRAYAYEILGEDLAIGPEAMDRAWLLGNLTFNESTDSEEIERLLVRR